jgi:hypothetical protein
MARKALLLGGWEWVATPEGGPFVSAGGRLGSPPLLPQSERVMLALQGLLHATYEAAAEAADRHMRTDEAVRWWHVVGVRPAPEGGPVDRPNEVLYLLRDLREAGQARGLLDEVGRRLSDEALVEREDLQESLEQMRRGEGTVLVARDDD